VSSHAEGQLRRLAEIARLLHRKNDAMRGTGRDLLQVAMQSYYVVSSSQLFLVCHSKQISKTPSIEQAKAKRPLRHHENLLLHDICQQLLRRARNAVLNLLQVLKASAETLDTGLRSCRTQTKDTSEPPHHGTSSTLERTTPSPTAHPTRATAVSWSSAQTAATRLYRKPPRHPQHQKSRKVAWHHD
jgi:hypothetical protein